MSGPLTFGIQQRMAPGAKSQSMEARTQEALVQIAESDAKSSLETMEHLAILKRWYYRSSRVGEIFLRDDKGALPLRRIVRGISRVYRGEKPEPEPVVAGDLPRGTQQI